MSESWLGVVTQTNPLRVRRDVPTSVPPDAPPISLVSGLVTGDRVFIRSQGRRYVIVGRVGGARKASWSPALLSTGSNPTMGNTTTVGRYIIGDDGMVHYTVRFDFGSTFGAGSGFYILPLPVNANTSGGLQWYASIHLNGPVIGGSHGESSGWGKIEDNTVTRSFFYRNDGTVGRVEATYAWPGSRIVYTGTYEAAA